MHPGSAAFTCGGKGGKARLWCSICLNSTEALRLAALANAALPNLVLPLPHPLQLLPSLPLKPRVTLHELFDYWLDMMRAEEKRQSLLLRGGAAAPALRPQSVAEPPLQPPLSME